MIHSRNAVLAVLLVLAAGQLQAQQYRWTDEKGRVQYTDTPPPASAKDAKKKNFNPGPPGVPPEPYELQVARKAAPVKLYSAPDCQACDQARSYLNQRGIPFQEVSVVSEAEHVDLKAVSGGATVPVMLVGSGVQRGFGESAYESMLDLAGYPKKGALPARNQAAPVAPKAPASPTANPAGKPAAGPPAESPGK